MKVTAILSMLHEPPQGKNSAHRRFRDQPVLAWTLYRVGRSKCITQSAVACWEDQISEVEPITEELNAFCSVRSPRVTLPQMQAVEASRRWADGWRGGLMSTCEFDRGFNANWILEIQSELQADAVILVDPAAGLVDAGLLDAIILHARQHPEIDFFFSPAAPGLSGVLIRNSMLEQLAKSGMNPGMLLAYRPDLPQRDPISCEAAVPIPAPIARTTQRFTLDSDRQIDRISIGTVHLNGELISTEAGQLLQTLSEQTTAGNVPREITLELNTNRKSSPLFWPGRHLKVNRAPMPMQNAAQIIEELASIDDIRLILGGVGDPLLHDNVFEIIERAHEAGIDAIALETDFLCDADAIERLADSPVDIVTLNLPAATAATYQLVMGVDAWTTVLENLKRFVQRRQSHRRGTPLIVPTMVKLNENLAEMEIWYDQWLRTLGSAVISGPAGYSGQIPELSVANMEPPQRRPCARQSKRLTVLCDGTVVACEQDVLGKSPLGTIGKDTLESIWNGAAAALRSDHLHGAWHKHPLCQACRDWHRP